MAATLSEIEAMRRAMTVEKALSEGVVGVPLLSAMRGASNVNDDGMGGFYNDDDEYTRYWLAGDLAGSAPNKKVLR